MLRKNVLPLAAVILAVAAGCAAEGSELEHSRPKREQSKTSAAQKKAGVESSPGVAQATAPASKGSPLPDLSPTPGKILSSPRQVLAGAPFAAGQPTVRANDRHAQPVTGKDCMTCHGTGGSAPHFAYAGTIALGKKWVVGTPAWTKAAAGSQPPPNEYADEYGGYGDDYGYCPDSDYDSYGDYGSYDTGGYSDDDDDYGGGSCGKRGWPEDRTNPSDHTGVRIVGADGNVFDAITDADGNFWFKSKEDVKVPAFTGIQYGNFTVTGSTNGVACGSCHESGKADSPGRLWTWDGPTPR